MRHLRSFSLALLLSVAAVACGGDDNSNPGLSGGTGAGTGGGGTGGAGVGGAGAGGTGGGTSGTGGGAADVCGSGVTTEALSNGAYDTRFTIPGFTGPDGITPIVYDFAKDVDGSLVATGRFQWYEGQTVPPLMRWKNGAWEPARTTWELPPPPDGFSAIAISDSGALALATADSYGAKDGEIWVDEGAGLQSVGTYDGQVRSLAWYDGLLWVAGNYKLTGVADPVAGLAVWDGAQWSAPPGGAATGVAFELTVDKGTLFVGGAFSQVGGIAAANVASYDGATWTPYDFPDALIVYAIDRTLSDQLYAGGAFGDFQKASGLAKWNGTTWETVGGGLAQLQTRGVVADIVAHGETVDVTGCFNSAGGLQGAAGAVTSRGVARWDGNAWASLDDDTKHTNSPWYQPGACGDEGPDAIWDAPYQRLAFDGDARVVAGGSFAGVSGTLSQSIVAYDGGQWVAQGEGKLGIGGETNRIAAGGDGCDVYAEGKFTHAGGVPAAGRVVHFNGAGWDVLKDSLPPDAWCPGFAVSPAGDPTLGCMIFPQEGDAQGQILRKNGDEMVPVDVGALGPVDAIAYSPSGTLWIAGSSGPTGYLARVDGDKLTMVESGFDSIVNQLDVAADDDIVVGGAFTHIGQAEVSRIAHWDGATWSSLGKGVPGQVLALARDGGTTYASTYDEGNGAYVLGAYDGTTWRELATPDSGLTKQSYFSFNRIRPVKGGVIVGGTAELDDKSGRGLLVYENNKFHALDGGVGAISVDDLALTGDSLWVAGSIGQAGPKDAVVSSVGVARYGFGM